MPLSFVSYIASNSPAPYRGLKASGVAPSGASSVAVSASSPTLDALLYWSRSITFRDTFSPAVMVRFSPISCSTSEPDACARASVTCTMKGAPGSLSRGALLSSCAHTLSSKSPASRAM